MWVDVKNGAGKIEANNSLGSEDLTENFCTNNENVDQLEKLNQAEKQK